MILFKKISWSNFLSTGQTPNTIQLNKSPSTLIVGENGAGKSSLLDAIMFVLYGKPYRNINKNQLINSIIGKNAMVEIEFKVGKHEYLVKRGIKPNVFEIYMDGKLIDQNANVREYQEHLEKNIIGLNAKSFTQIVVIGSANFTPFMQLKSKERRDIIEDLLDIEIFTKMFQLLKEKITANKDAITEHKYQIELMKEKIDLTKKHMQEIMAMKKSDVKAKKEKVAKLTDSMNAAFTEIDSYNKKVSDLSDTITDHDNVHGKIKKLDLYQNQMEHKLKHLETELEFFSVNDSCPTCSQDIDEDFKGAKYAEYDDKKQELNDGIDQLTGHYDGLIARLNEIAEVQQEINKHNKRIIELNTDASSYQRQIKELTKTITEEEAVHDTDNKLSELKELEDEVSVAEENYSDHLRRKELYDISASLLKDSGIKSKIIKQYVPVINKLMNKHLAAMDFFVQFELDENFNEKIRSRFRDEFTYDSFSEGEKARLDMGLLLTWRAVAKLRNSATTNLLIMDEIFDGSMDGDGMSSLLSIMHNVLGDNNVFVISHRGDQLYDKFHSMIRFQKVKNFSQIEV